eukprot:jgi/Hompol1/4894/HPOL_001037-RA
MSDSVSDSVRDSDRETKWTAFMQWLSARGFKPHALEPHNFEGSGRGLRAVEPLAAGAVVVRIPFALLLSHSVAVAAFNASSAVAALKPHASIALLLAWLTVHRLNISPNGSAKPDPDHPTDHTDADTLLAAEWSPYLDVLPQSFDSVPYFMPPSLQSLLPQDIKAELFALVLHTYSHTRTPTYPHCIGLPDKVSKQASQIDNDYSACTAALASARPHTLHSLPRDLFSWAWFVVNTRCISLNATSTQSSHSNNTPQKLVLAPFLDCLNHTPTARITAGYNHAERAYIIKTLVPFDAGSQVFINYGPHDNNFLLAEYGFVVDQNPFNHVVLDDVLDQLVKQTRGVEDILRNEGLLGYISVDLERKTLAQLDAIIQTKLAALQSSSAAYYKKLLTS